MSSVHESIHPGEWSRALGTSDRFWMNLQTRYDLDVQLENQRDQLDKIKKLVA